ATHPSPARAGRRSLAPCVFLCCEPCCGVVCEGVGGVVVAEHVVAVADKDSPPAPVLANEWAGHDATASHRSNGSPWLLSSCTVSPSTTSSALRSAVQPFLMYCVPSQRRFTCEGESGKVRMSVLPLGGDTDAALGQLVREVGVPVLGVRREY